MVRHGLGVALLPHTAIAADVARGTLRAIQLEGVPRMLRRIIAVRRRGSVDSVPLVGFFSVLSEIDGVLPGRGTILA